MLVEETRPSHAFGAEGQTFVVIWRQQVATDAVDNLFTLLDRFLESHAPAAGLLVVVAPECELPTRAAQGKIQAGLKARVSSLTNGVAVAIEGSGVQAQLGRSIAAMINLLTRGRNPSYVVATVNDAAGHLVSAAETAALVGGVGTLRSTDQPN